MNSITEKLDPREALEREIRNDHTRPRYVFASVSRQPIWCHEAERMADEIDINEIMMIVADNYLGDGKYDELKIGHDITALYEAGLECEVNTLELDLKAEVMNHDA